MYKLVLLSVMLATLAIPLWASRDASAARGVKKTLVLLAVFAVAYLLLLQLVYPKLYYPKL